MSVIGHSDGAVEDFIDAWAHDYANDAWRALSADGQMQAARAMMDAACHSHRGGSRPMTECQACGIALDEVRAAAAAEAASGHGGFVMCAGCRDAADLQREVNQLRGAVEAGRRLLRRFTAPGGQSAASAPLSAELEAVLTDTALHFAGARVSADAVVAKVREHLAQLAAVRGEG